MTNSKVACAWACTAFGVCLLASYYVFAGAWAAIDEAVFFFFNSRLVPGSFFLSLVAYTNMRAFDIVALCCMGGLYFFYFRQMDNAGKRTLICLGLSMLLAGIVIKQCGDLLPISHKSPSLFFENATRLTQLTDINTKDAARNSFPGDHGMMLMIFAAYVGRYFGKRAFMLAAVMVVIFSAPRIASGAHWFSDIFMGSLAISSITLSWLLLTSASDKLAAFFNRFLPSGFFPVDGTGIFKK